MRYTPEHKENTRAHLLEAAGALVKKDGFGVTGVDRLMAAVGLTSGAFYSHFHSKAELLEAIVESELTRSLNLFAGKTDEQLIAALENYLSIHHVDHPDQGCVVTALTVEVARARTETQQIFERQMQQIRAAIQQHVGDESTAWAIICQAVGAVMIARAMATEDARRSVLEGVMQQVKERLAAAQ